MAGKLSAKTQEELEFMEGVLKQVSHMVAQVEQYASAKTKAPMDMYLSQITRSLTRLRQTAMIKNLGFIADAAGILGVAAMRGSQVQRTRVMREGMVSLKQLIERTMKATTDADKREHAEKEKEQAKAAAAKAPAAGTDAAEPTTTEGGS